MEVIEMKKADKVKNFIKEYEPEIIGALIGGAAAALAALAYNKGFNDGCGYCKLEFEALEAENKLIEFATAGMKATQEH